MARNPRLMTPETRLAAMQAADAARRAAVKVCAEAPIGSAQYRAAVRILDALCDLAMALSQATIVPSRHASMADSIGMLRPGVH
ncbi:hypothetical protein [Falsiroseomonas sp.]|uniref:hypothetical protein n=1 Tax=Falsiroseomonas sp. TaxID=2870721 RepID=UPI003F704CBF